MLFPLKKFPNYPLLNSYPASPIMNLQILTARSPIKMSPPFLTGKLFSTILTLPLRGQHSAKDTKVTKDNAHKMNPFPLCVRSVLCV